MKTTNLACKQILSFLFTFYLINSVHAQTIYTVAGNGGNMSSVGYWGDGGLATDASTPAPDDVCLDSAGNMYLTCVNSVRRVDALTGIISLIAGNGSTVDTGDGGPAINAGMRYPNGLCLDRLGNLYVTEYSGHRVRKINLASGIITTVAGNGSQGFSGDDGPAIDAQLNTPNGICADDNNNLYIADSYNGRIRKVDQATGVISTIATGYYPNNICIDKAGNIYTSQTTYVYKWDPVTATSSVVAGNGIYNYSGDGGLATDASIFDASGLCVDGDGNVYVAEYDDSRVRKIDHSTGIITTIAGTGNNGFNGDYVDLLTAELGSPIGLICDNRGSLYVCDNQNNRIRKIVPLGCYWTGTASDRWENPANWSGGHLPNANTDVILRSGSNVAIKSNVIVQSLSAMHGAKLTVISPYTLTLSFSSAQ